MVDHTPPADPARANGPSDPVRGLTRTIDDTLHMLGEYRPRNGKGLPPNAEPITGLLDQCRKLTDKSHDLPIEPIRTIHHFACTGGTLFSKCIAAMPNVQLLSEIDPLSTMQGDGSKPRFDPTDVITQLRQSTRGASNRIALDLFVDNIRLIRDDCAGQGLHLVLRDHAHSQFCTKQAPSSRPTLRQMLVDAKLPVHSILTVRHPIQSYIALREHKWLHFEPPTLEEYCRRYLAFLGQYDGVTIVRYEELLKDPESTLRTLADHMALAPQPQLQSLLSAFKLTGDSGRSRPTISARPPRPVPDSVAKEIDNSESLIPLLKHFGYTSRTA